MSKRETIARLIDMAVFKAVFVISRDTSTWNMFAVKPDGIWVVPPPDDGLLYSHEMACLYHHPTGNLMEPALKFPCTLGYLKAFMEWCDYGKLDDEDLAELEAIARYRLFATDSQNK